MKSIPEPEYRRAGAGGIDSRQASPEGSGAGEHPDQIVTRNGKPVSVILPIKACQELLERPEDAEDVAWLRKRRTEAAPLPAARGSAANTMSTITEIQEAIARLPANEKSALSAWLQSQEEPVMSEAEEAALLASLDKAAAELDAGKGIPIERVREDIRR